MGHEENLDEYEVVSVRTPSGVRALASWFHQDWKLVYPDAPTAARVYIQGLSSSERALLRRELKAFLEANSGKSAEEVREAWLALGAGSWPKDGSTVATLTAILETL